MLEGLAKIQGLLISILIFFVAWKMLTDIYGGMPNRAEVAVAYTSTLGHSGQR